MFLYHFAWKSKVEQQNFKESMSDRLNYPVRDLVSKVT